MIGDLAAGDRSATGARTRSSRRSPCSRHGTSRAASAARVAGQEDPPVPLRRQGDDGDDRAALRRGRAPASRIRFGGTLGWLSWLGLHLVFLVGFRNRLVVFVNWVWNYFTWDRGNRIIMPPSDASNESAA